MVTTTWRRRLPWVAALLLSLVVVPVLVAVGAVADDQPVSDGEPAPRTVLATEQVRVVDEDATETSRRTAAESVDPVTFLDGEAQSAIVSDVRAVFSAAREVRESAADDDDEPSSSDQRRELLSLVGELDEEVAAALIDLSEGQLDTVERETIAIAQELARQRVGEEDLDDLLADRLPGEVAVRPLPGDTAQAVAVPLIEGAMRPTVRVDPDATADARERAADAAEDVVRVWRSGEAIVREGEVVDSLQSQAIAQLGFEGSSPLRALMRAGLAMLLVVGVGAVYLRRMQPRFGADGPKVLLLSLLISVYAVIVIGVGVFSDVTTSTWYYAVPAGALAMLVALLIHPVVGVAMMLPAALLVLVIAPPAGPAALFLAATVLVSVPLTRGIGSRSDLRSATLRAGLSYPLLALVTIGIFGPHSEVFVALGAGAINGLVTTLAVQGALPFLETMFRLPTVTALLDLADRNHPLLRELESEALGSYNHSVMVASLTERACRAIGADPLLGSVAALYHDIGKVRQPHFFIENQHGISNPHDELAPEVSAVIIQNHVIDGVEMATEHRLPPEVVACIGSHHGTMVVTYFYQQAVQAAGDADEVDADQFRYKGAKPRSKEAAVLVLADCSEAATRAMAMHRGTLPREEIEETVDHLLQERVDDGQFDECDLTFRELQTTRDTIVESLVGVYHPRIAYPGGAGADAADVEPTPAGR